MIRIYIIEDHPIIVDGIKQRLRHHQEEMSLSGWSQSVEQFVMSTTSDAFDIIILDLWLPGKDPVHNLKMVKTHFPGKPVVILTQETSTYWIRVMMENGANAYLFKNVERREFKETIEKVFQGKTVAPVILLDENAAYSGNTLVPQKYFLKPSERSIVIRLAEGANLKTIADERISTVSAVEKTLKKIRDKFGVQNNPGLIKVLIEQKLI